jgi:hypothetical protein
MTAMKTKPKKIIRKTELKELKKYSKARVPVVTVSKLTKRTIGSLRVKASELGIGLGYQR